MLSIYGRSWPPAHLAAHSEGYTAAPAHYSPSANRDGTGQRQLASQHKSQHSCNCTSAALHSAHCRPSLCPTCTLNGSRSKRGAPGGIAVRHCYEAARPCETYHHSVRLCKVYAVLNEVFAVFYIEADVVCRLCFHDFVAPGPEYARIGRWHHVNESLLLPGRSHRLHMGLGSLCCTVIL